MSKAVRHLVPQLISKQFILMKNFIKNQAMGHQGLKWVKEIK